MFILKQGISPEVFYGERYAEQDKIEELINKNDFRENERPKFMTQLLGPSKTWKIFKKQQDAIECCLLRRNGLMPFAFEEFNNRRMFLAAHPKVFWALNYHRFFKSCNSYEIITEYSACKLYLDIEFEYKYNKHKDGERLLSHMLAVINFNLELLFNVTCTEDDILDLDSSCDTKFSHHIIYEIRNMAFQHNYAVGNFVKKICSELREAFESSLGDGKKLQEVAKKYNMLENDIIELFIRDRKGQSKLIIDEGVYTKNRHFRLLGSSKQGKNIPLKIASNSKYKPNGKSDLLEYFLDSLVTYFSWQVDRVLQFSHKETLKPDRVEKKPKTVEAETETESSLFPQIDSFINSLISPRGKIRRKVFFRNNSTIVYDIQGFRYCSNIEKEHKSNNIKYIVNLNSLSFYQKCHDPDCLNFRSDMRRLPEEICFLFEDDSLLATVQEFPEEEEFVKAIEQIENENSFEQSISDEELEKVVDCAEAMLTVDW